MYGQMADERPKTKLQHEIDQNLKRVYENALNEEVPDKFKILLAQLKAREVKK